MSWVKQTPAWAWLLFIAAVTLKFAATVVFDSSPSAFAIIAYGVSVALFSGLAYLRWKYGDPSEVKLLSPHPEPEKPPGSDRPGLPAAISPKDPVKRRAFPIPVPAPPPRTRSRKPAPPRP